MADEETEKPKRPRRRRKPKEAEAASASEAQRASEAEGEATALDASASDGDASSTPEPVDEVEPTPADEEAADEAADVVLEAEAEVDEDSEAEAEKTKRAPRRRRAAKPKAEEEAEDAEEEPEAEKPARPAPTRRRVKRDPSLPPPEVRAHAKYVRSSARKARLVCDHIRGKSVEDARAILALTPRAVARDWSKLLESAIANAENNHELVGEDLYVKVVHADEGPTLKRFRPRAMGRATQIRKRTSHLTILLTPKD
jgi:ribosomal protein L22